jgi:hypothetical protein
VHNEHNARNSKPFIASDSTPDRLAHHVTGHRQETPTRTAQDMVADMVMVMVMILDIPRVPPGGVQVFLS